MAKNNKKKKIKPILIIVIFVFILLGIVIGIRLFSGEDVWVCRNGEWVKHGYPANPMPIEECVDN